MINQSTQDNKKQMRIALVGIAPADQITLKGYFRVLLRLDVSLEWVAATESNIDLFIIHHQFKTANSVTKLLNTYRNVPVLYVNRNDYSEEGGIQQNLLTLPLKQINLLNDWLVRHVIVLSNPQTQNMPDIPSTEPNNPLANEQPIHSTQKTTSSQDSQTKNTAYLAPIIDFIEKMQERNQGLIEVFDSNGSVAIIDTNRQFAWVKNTSARLNEDWKTKAYVGTPQGLPQDSLAWLWQVAWDNDNKLLLDLVGEHTPYQIRYWVKPDTKDRRHLLQIMTAMEYAPNTIRQISMRTDIPIETVKKAIAALLTSGHLSKTSYQSLQSILSSTQTTYKTTVAETIPQAEPKPEPQPEHIEKMGFLARLRRRLGL